MLKNPIYKPKGAALEYADYALNIYTECPHGCTYCYARAMAKRFGKPWTGEVKPRDGIIEAVKNQLGTGKFEFKKIHLCFSCDPYPNGIDCTPTQEIIKLIKEHDANVQVLTKGNILSAANDANLFFDNRDFLGVSYTGLDPAHEHYWNEFFLLYGLIEVPLFVNTWLSCEPILNKANMLNMVKNLSFGKFSFGMLSGYKPDADFLPFVKELVKICEERGLNYQLKESIKKHLPK